MADSCEMCVRDVNILHSVDTDLRENLHHVLVEIRAADFIDKMDNICELCLSIVQNIMSAEQKAEKAKEAVIDCEAKAKAAETKAKADKANAKAAEEQVTISNNAMKRHMEESRANFVKKLRRISDIVKCRLEDDSADENRREQKSQRRLTSTPTSANFESQIRNKINFPATSSPQKSSRLSESVGVHPSNLSCGNFFETDGVTHFINECDAK